MVNFVNHIRWQFLHLLHERVVFIALVARIDVVAHFPYASDAPSLMMRCPGVAQTKNMAIGIHFLIAEPRSTTNPIKLLRSFIYSACAPRRITSFPRMKRYSALVSRVVLYSGLCAAHFISQIARSRSFILHSL
jgi:hypothetical protein